MSRHKALMAMDDSIQVLDIQEVEKFFYTDPEGIVVVMPCIDKEKGLQTAEVLLRRAELSCKILVVLDSLRQGFIKTFNVTASRLGTKYLVYLAQDAWPGRGWLKCAYEILENSGKGLFAFNDGKWRGRIASFGMVRVSWVTALYGGNVFYPGYLAHEADKELTVIAKVQDQFDYNPECVLVEYDPDKDIHGYSNSYDSALFNGRFLCGFDGLLSVNELEIWARHYKVSWTPSASIVVPACEEFGQVRELLESFLQSQMQNPLELILIMQECPELIAEISANYACRALLRLLSAGSQDPWVFMLNKAVEKSTRGYLFFVFQPLACTSEILSSSLSRLSNQKVGAVFICEDIAQGCKESEVRILACRKQDVQKVGGFDPQSGKDHVRTLLRAMAKSLGRKKICLYHIAKREWRTIQAKDWLKF